MWGAACLLGELLRDQHWRSCRWLIAGIVWYFGEDSGPPCLCYRMLVNSVLIQRVWSAAVVVKLELKLGACSVSVVEHPLVTDFGEVEFVSGGEDEY